MRIKKSTYPIFSEALPNLIVIFSTKNRNSYQARNNKAQKEQNLQHYVVPDALEDKIMSATTYVASNH